MASASTASGRRLGAPRPMGVWPRWLTGSLALAASGAALLLAVGTVEVAAAGAPSEGRRLLGEVPLHAAEDPLPNVQEPPPPPAPAPQPLPVVQAEATPSPAPEPIGVGNGTGSTAAPEAPSDDKEGDSSKVRSFPVLTVTFSVLLFGVLLWNMVLFRFMHSRDGHVRSFIFSMLSTSMAIFCAVLLNKSLESWLYRGLGAWLHLPCTNGECDVHPKHRFIVGSLVCVVSFKLISVLSYALPKRYRSLGQMAALVSAFAGITAFTAVQNVCITRFHTTWALMLTAFVATVLLSAVSTWTYVARNFHRCVWKKQDDPQYNEIEIEVWEAEDHACVLIASYLMQRAVVFFLTDTKEIDPLEGLNVHPKKSEVRYFMFMALIFGLVTAFVTLVRVSDTERRPAADCRKRFMGSFAGNCQSFTASSTSLSLLRLSTWWTTSFIAAYMVQVQELDPLVNAAAVSLAVLPCVLVLDKIAESFSGGDEEGVILSTKLRRPSGSVYTAVQSTVEAPALGAQDGGTGALAAGSPADYTKELPTTAPDGGVDFFRCEKAFRVLMDSLGLLVGLAWEAAYDRASEAVVEGVPYVNEHQVIARGSLAILCVALVLPTWLTRFAPQAHKSWRGHKVEAELMEHLTELATRLEVSGRSQIALMMEILGKAEDQNYLKEQLDLANENGRLRAELAEIRRRAEEEARQAEPEAEHNGEDGDARDVLLKAGRLEEGAGADTAQTSASSSWWPWRR